MKSKRLLQIASVILDRVIIIGAMISRGHLHLAALDAQEAIVLARLDTQLRITLRKLTSHLQRLNLVPLGSLRGKKLLHVARCGVFFG